MRKIFTLVSAVVLSLTMQATPIDTIQVDGLYYQLDDAQTATLIRLNTNAKYEIDNIVIPVSVSKDDVIYPVVALGQGALRNTTASSISFAEGSQVTSIGMQAFQAAVNVQELELPEGITLIPMTCIHNATATNPMTMKRLVLPSTLDSLALFSICLPQLETIEFKGSVPPSIATKETATWTQNPWMINVNNACNTATNATVIVPVGAVEAYRNTAWIGDYFTTIEEEAETAVGNLNANNDKVVKFLENGQLIIMYNGTKYNVHGEIMK